jgi:hypothetical protein
MYSGNTQPRSNLDRVTCHRIYCLVVCQGEWLNNAQKYAMLVSFQMHMYSHFNLIRRYVTSKVQTASFNRSLLLNVPMKAETDSLAIQQCLVNCCSIPGSPCSYGSTINPLQYYARTKAQQLRLTYARFSTIVTVTKLHALRQYPARNRCAANLYKKLHIRTQESEKREYTLFHKKNL